MKKYKSIYAFAFIAILFSCSSDDNSVTDTEKPAIVIHAPTNDQEFHTTDEIYANISFSDNVELASYKIDIHFAGDGHAHRQMQDDFIEWNYETAGIISGKNDKINLNITIPENTKEGHYHFGVYALDQAGNQEVQWIELNIHSHAHE